MRQGRGYSANRFAGLCILPVLSLVLASNARCESDSKTSQVQPNYSQEATLGTARLQAWYDPSTGLYQTTGWWNSANAITVLVDYSKLMDSREYDSVFSNTLTAAQKTSQGFINKFYDDEGWWALAWIDAYDLGRDPRYLTMAASLFSDMVGGWDDRCGGGVWWSKDKTDKNAIENELFLSVAAHLANRVDSKERAQYLAWADREWQWFLHTGMINSENLVNDGLTMDSCQNNRKTTWTYNQGVIVGGLVELNRAYSSAGLLSQAEAIADAAIEKLADKQGILHDPCEPDCGGDGVQFKGIFVRNLRLLEEVVPGQRYKSFVFKNADSIWSAARGPENQLGTVWSGPYTAANAGSQASALDALLAAVQARQQEEKGHKRTAKHGL
jgi:predicted alpha-1,6-mannanase (GH76 family)